MHYHFLFLHYHYPHHTITHMMPPHSKPYFLTTVLPTTTLISTFCFSFCFFFFFVKNYLGINFHRRICQLEFDINAYKKRKRFEKSKPIRLDIEQMWYPLREIQAEDAAKSKATADQNATESYYQCEMQYLAYRKDLQEARSNATSMRTLGGINRVVSCHFRNIIRRRISVIVIAILVTGLMRRWLIQ